MLKRLIHWFADWKLKEPVRFWDEKEWELMSPKSKIWIWYKHHWNLINQGSGEIDRILFFGNLDDLYKMMGMIAFLQVLFNVPWFLTLLLAVFLEIINIVVQWWIGEWKDKKDLIALEAEINNRRHWVFRELRRVHKKMDKIREGEVK